MISGLSESGHRRHVVAGVMALGTFIDTIKRINLKTVLQILAASFLLTACVANSGRGVNVAQQLDKKTSKSQAANKASSYHSLNRRLAEQFSEQGQYQLAIPYYKQAIDANAGDLVSHIGLGKALMAVGEYAEAKTVYDHVLAKSPHHPKALTGMGTIYMAFDELVVSEEFFQTALRSSPAPVDAYIGLAIIYDLTGRHEMAMSLYGDALAEHGNDPHLLSNQALSMVLFNQLEEGFDILQSLANSEYSTVQVRQNLAMAQMFRGNKRTAIQIAAIDLEPLAAEDTVLGFEALYHMAPTQRMGTLLFGFSNDRYDREHPANFVVEGTDETKMDAVDRLIEMPEPEPEPEPVPEPEPEIEIPPMIEPEGWAVQIAAYRYAKEVMPGWRLLKKKYDSIIGHLEPRRSEKDFGAHLEKGPKGFFFRLNAGPLESFSAALEICQKLEAAGGECWIRPPESAEGKLPQ